MWRAVVLFLLITSGEGRAFQVSPPERHDVYSADGRFVIDVDPRAGLLTVEATENRSVPLWSFSKYISRQKVFLSNDGRVIAVVDWTFVREDMMSEPCVEFWDNTGRFKAFSFIELCPDAEASEGPNAVGTWRSWLADVESDGEQLRVKTTENYEYSLSLSDGQIVSKRAIGRRAVIQWICFGLFACAVLVGILFCIRRMRPIPPTDEQQDG